MAPVIRCALVIAGLTYYSPYRGVVALPESVLDLGQPAAEALGVPLSHQEIELLRRAPALVGGVSDSLEAISQSLGTEPSPAAPRRIPDPPTYRLPPGQGKESLQPAPR